MHLWQFAICGAAGGALVEVLAIFAAFAAWQHDRRTPSGKIKEKRPALGLYIDVPAHAWMTLFRTVLGTSAALLFAANGQITGPHVAVALGFSAPAVLAQVGHNQFVASIVAGSPKTSATLHQTIDSGQVEQRLRSVRAPQESKKGE